MFQTAIAVKRFVLRQPILIAFSLSAIMMSIIYITVIQFDKKLEPYAAARCKKSGGAYIEQIMGGWRCISATGDAITVIRSSDAIDDKEIDEIRKDIQNGTMGRHIKPV